MILTADTLLLSYMDFLEALFIFYLILYIFFSQVEDGGQDIDIANDHGHCCRLCHQDVAAFSDILRLSNCDRLEFLFVANMALTVSAVELEDCFFVMGVLLFVLIGLIVEILVKRREQIFEDVKKSSDNLKNCICGCGVDRCAIYQEDLKALEKTLENSNCKHIKAIFASFKAAP
uniref:Uncharacterized protein n=1 Tax=Brassica oleracea TaxID=3712 RepID=A0A3P6AWZ0_BRAOL|nr:unnamed protein product [Brassica oleracea]